MRVPFYYTFMFKAVVFKYACFASPNISTIEEQQQYHGVA